MPSPAIRILAFACGAVLSAGVLSAVTHDDAASVDLDQAAVDRDREATTSSTTAVETTEPTTTADAAGTDPATEGDEATDTAAPPSTAAPEPAPTTSPAPDPTETVIGTTPGRYLYDTTGTANGKDVSGTSTLDVAPAEADGRQTHVQSTPEGTTTSVYRHATEGTFLESLAVEADEGSFTLEATSPYLLVPADAVAGTTTQGVLEGDGVTAAITFTVVEVTDETTTATLDVELSGTIRGFDVEGTMDSTIVARSTDQLPLDTHASTDIVVGGGLFRMQSDTHSVLRR